MSHKRFWHSSLQTVVFHKENEKNLKDTIVNKVQPQSVVQKSSMFTRTSLQLFVTRHALRTSACRASRLGKLLLDDRLFGMYLVVEKLCRQHIAVINLHLL